MAIAASVERHGSSRRLRWLHIPKTGSTFINVAVRFGCPELRRYNATFHMAQDFNAWHAQHQESCPGLAPPWLGHVPLAPRDLESDGPLLVAMFRRPSQRLLSGFYHVDGTSEVLRANTMIAPGMAPVQREAMRRVVGDNASRYARWPGIASCATKMLVGRACASDGVPSADDVVRAKWLVRERLAFVGLREEWETSICTFHALFRPRATIHASEVTLLHAGPLRKAGQIDSRNAAHEYDERQLRDFVDVHDEEVYAAARARFFADASRTGCRLRDAPVSLAPRTPTG